jgi:SAM-dependent methyltransferase
MSRWRLSPRGAREGISRRLWPKARHMFADDLPPLRGLAVVDLGCGCRPNPAATAVVEPYLTPVSRADGVLDPDTLAARGIRVVRQPMDTDLPFRDKEFDFAICSHAIEHVEHPGKACQEMIRIAKAGLITAPFLFGDLLFGREYHRWLLVDRGGVLYFFRKRPEEDRPFGPWPNPFDAALRTSAWRPRRSPFGRISRRLSELYYSHHRAIEVRFAWADSFHWVVAED